MGIIRNKTPIECAFHYWISNYPESFHPLDMQRFYVLVKTLKRYSRKPRSGRWLRDKIKQSKKSMKEENISHFCELFETFLKYDNAYPLPLYFLTKDDKHRTRSCVKGKIIEREGIKQP